MLGRLAVAGYPHYVILHGHNGNDLFRRGSDYQYYLSLLGEAQSEFAVEAQGWCLLPSEVHLLLHPESEADFTACMRRLGQAYTRQFNNRYNHKGSPWQGSFLNGVVAPGQWRLNCLRYMEMLPVRRGLARSLDGYPWTSWQVRRLNGSQVDRDADYLALAENEQERLRLYREFIKAGASSSEEDTILTRARRGQLIGDAAFVDEIERVTGRRVEPRGPGRP